MPELHLKYFDIRGVAEMSRLLLAAGKLPYTETRFPISVDMGPDGKPDFSTIKRDEFNAAKAAGELKVGAGKVPILVVDGTVEFGQSKAIERYIATIGGMRGANAIEAAQIDQLVEQVIDIKNAYQKSDKGEKWFGEELPAMMTAFEDIVAPAIRDGPITYADIAIYYFFGFFCDNVDATQAALAASPNVLAMSNKAKTNPEIQAYEATRKVTPL